MLSTVLRALQLIVFLAAVVLVTVVFTHLLVYVIGNTPDLSQLPEHLLNALLGLPALARTVFRGQLPAHSLITLRSLRACAHQLQPDAHAIAAAWGCFSEVTSLEFAQLRHTLASTPTKQQGEGGVVGVAGVGGATGGERESLTWTPQIQLQWFAPFYSGGGYSSEAISYVTELTKWLHVGIMQHGDSLNHDFTAGLPKELKNTLAAATRRRLELSRSVQVCHSEPGAWSVPTPKYHTSECPSPNAAYTIGRTMFETDRLPDGWPPRLRAMHEIWVPTQFHREVFEKNGVPPSMLQVMPEAVDTQLFDPSVHLPLDVMAADKRFKFLSVFKWEARKGWDVLLRAFLSEFSAEENKASLYIRTTAYHSDSFFREKIQRFAKDELQITSPMALDHIMILDKELPLHQLPRLYKGADAFVLPSRGEGWGRPHIESMAMGLPTIATNWSGNTEFMKENNSYLIPIDGLEPVKEGAFQGHLWATPSIEALRKIMRQVVTDPAAARKVGDKGSFDVRTKYNPAAVAKVLLARLEKIQNILLSKGVLLKTEL